MEYPYIVIVGTGIMLIMALFIVLFVMYYQRKQIEQQMRVKDMEAEFQRKLLEVSMASTEAERRRIAQDLHDDIGQSLSMIKSKISHSKCNQEDKILETELSRVIEQTREISRNLYPSYLEKIGLIRSIARLMENIQASSHLECSFDVTERVEDLSISVKTHIYRMLQECTNNTICAFVAILYYVIPRFYVICSWLRSRMINPIEFLPAFL